jgi:PAS domain S-box-containing protein
MDGKSAAMARQLDAAQAITHTGSWEWDLASGTVTWSDELYRIYGLPRDKPITLDVFLSSLLPEDKDRIYGEVQAAIARGGRFAYRERVVRPDGSVRVLDTVGEVVADDTGKAASLLGTCRDITDHERLEAVQAGERRALEQLASGAPLREVLATIVGFIEAICPDCIGSILLLDEDGQHLHHGAAPRLPDEYNAALEGLPIGPAAGSCGTAAYTRQPVVVTDIATDPLWAPYKHLALPHGLRACWSFPIIADERVLGTFAMYYPTVRAPDDWARALIARAVHVAAIAIERRQLDDQLRALSERIEAAREEERTNIAREIHDELGQALTALKLDLGWVARRINGDPALGPKLETMAHATDEILAQVRRISAELRPGILDDLGLRAAIEWQAEEFARRTSTGCTVKTEIGDLRLERSLATAVFRIFQEALTNVARHASATEVDVTLRLERGQLKLDVADDGVGVPEIAPRSTTLGLLGMRERARRVGGDCQIKRRSPRGTIVSVSVPLRFPAERDLTA